MKDNKVWSHDRPNLTLDPSMCKYVLVEIETVIISSYYYFLAIENEQAVG